MLLLLKIIYIFDPASWTKYWKSLKSPGNRPSLPSQAKTASCYTSPRGLLLWTLQSGSCFTIAFPSLNWVCKYWQYEYLKNGSCISSVGNLPRCNIIVYCSLQKKHAAALVSCHKLSFFNTPYYNRASSSAVTCILLILIQIAKKVNKYFQTK